MGYEFISYGYFLVCFGLVMIYSTSSYEAAMKFGDSTFYLKRQLLATVLGIIVMFLQPPLIIIGGENMRILAYIATIICIVLVLTPIGIEANGARRWIGVGSFSFQPAELAKLSIILFLHFSYLRSQIW